MTITNNNTRTLHRKEWQMMTPAPTASVAGSFIVKDPLWIKRSTLFVTSATSQYLYWVDEDSWMQIPSMALAWTFWAWACGTWSCWSNTLTATGWTTTTLTLSTAINGACLWETIRFLTWTNIWNEVTVTAVKIIPWWTNTITFTPALSNAVTNETFAVSTWRYFVMNAWTVASWIFKSIDPLTWVITTLWTTWLPASWWTEWRLVATPSYVWAYATWTATSATSTTLVNSAKTWTVNQWCNYQVRITAWTWIWQVRPITTNASTALTVPTWTITPDATSQYSIEANDDYIYLIGNNVVTMYRYSISGNTWSTISPTTARSAAMVAWWWANWVWKTWKSVWADESAILDWRYIYSWRWWASSTMDRYDIAWWTNWAWAWANITYIWATETFTTWSSYDCNWNQIYLRKDATNRIFQYIIDWNYLYPFNTNLYTDWTALLWDKLFTARVTDWTTSIDWLYSLRNTWTELHRIMIF